MGINPLMDIQRLREKVDRLEREIGHLPSRWAGSPAENPVKKLIIVDGQTVYDVGGITYYGVDWAGTTIASVPTLYDPNGVSSTPGSFTAITGIGRARLLIDGIEQDDLVLCYHFSGFTYSVITGDPILVSEVMRLPDDAETGFVDVYRFAFP